MINMTKNKNFEVPPAGIFTGLPFESLRSAVSDVNDGEEVENSLTLNELKES
jgi:hypothetical protein